MANITTYVRLLLGLNKNKLAIMLDKTPSGIKKMEQASRIHIQDLTFLRHISGLSWEDFGSVLDKIAEDGEE